MKCLFSFLAGLALAFPAAAQDRTWTSADGKHTLIARLDKADLIAATLIKPDGKTLTVKTAELSKEDRQVIRSKILNDFRATHTAWTAKAVGVRAQVIDETSSTFGMGSDARPHYDVQHHQHTVPAKFYYRQPFQGVFVAQVGNDVEISVRIFDRRGQLIGTQPGKFKFQNLGFDDQKFITEFRKLETATK